MDLIRLALLQTQKQSQVRQDMLRDSKAIEDKGSSILSITQICGYSLAGNTSMMRQRNMYMYTKTSSLKLPTKGQYKVEPTT